MDRRDFLKMFAASATFTMFRPLEVMSGEKLNRPVRIGFIGTGNRGTYGVVTAMSHNNNIEIYALADLFRDRIDQVLPQALVVECLTAYIATLCFRHHIQAQP